MAALRNAKVAKHLNHLTDKIIKSVEKICIDIRSNMRVQGLGEFAFYFSDHGVTNYRDAISTDNVSGASFLRLQRYSQHKGIRFLPRHICHGFSYSNTENSIEALVMAIRESLPRLDR
jgi:glutamate-1-semialdehyde aminotransferase